MPYSPFIGWDQARLETQLDELQQQKADGKTIISAGAGDVTATERVGTSIDLCLEQVLAALYYLDQAGQVSPAGKYPRESCFRARRTSPRYIWGA